MGNLTRDVEVRSIPSGTSVGKFALAVNRKWKGKDGDSNEDTTFVDCEAWGRTAETLSRYVGKGDPLFLCGRLRMEQWQDKNGQRRSKLVVVVEQFQFIGGRPDDLAERPEPAGLVDAGPARQATFSDDDIPF